MNIDNLINQCYSQLPQDVRQTPWALTNHGRAILETEDQLNAYTVAYGEMHAIKCRAALQNFPFDELQNIPFEIFDWGCGQGIASIILIEMLYERQLLSTLRRITLIEPSAAALERAKKWVSQFAGPGIEIKCINKFIPQNENDAIFSNLACDSYSSINLFSNVLDIRSISLSWLATTTASLAPTNYMICVGPKFIHVENSRINDFYGYFNSDNVFSDFSSSPYGYTKNGHPFGCEVKCFVHKRTEQLVSNYVERANGQDVIDIFDYDPENHEAIINDPLIGFYNKLHSQCGGSYKIFISPRLNCDRVDFMMLSISKGVILINICNDISKLDSEFTRIENIKQQFFDIHLRSMLIDSIINSCVYYNIKTALYFPNSTKEEIEAKCAELNELKNLSEKERQKNRLGDNFNAEEFIEKDYYDRLIRLSKQSDLNDIFENNNVQRFKSEYYTEILKLVSDSWHSYKYGDQNLRLTTRQKEIAENQSQKLRVKGVAGCGKTQVVASRAVKQHLKTGSKVLIITYNIALIQYIKMRINQVPADFDPNMFEITNYHQFFKSMAIRYRENSSEPANNIQTQLRRFSLQDWDNVDFFSPYVDKIEKYKTIIIDEVQDFKEEWLRIIIKYFLEEGGTISVFGDGEQNIYDRFVEAESNMPRIPTFQGRWNEMSERISMRIINPKIAELASNFARQFIRNSHQAISIERSLEFETFNIKYWHRDNSILASQIAQNIQWIISNYQLNERDVTVLGQSINLLRAVENEYTLRSQKTCMTTFETQSQHEALVRNYGYSPSLFENKQKSIRRVAKTHFTTDCEQIKLSTIHSFKGWESKNIILILQPQCDLNDPLNGYSVLQRENTSALIYTAITRTKCNLFIINIANEKYHNFFQTHIN